MIVAVAGVPLVVQQMWLRLIRPWRQQTKLQRAYALMQEWFDEIDRTLEQGVDERRLARREGEVDAYLQDPLVARYPMRFSRRFRREFLQGVDLPDEVLDSEVLFEKYTRAHVGGTDLGTWWSMTQGAFYGLYAEYLRRGPDANWADVQMRVRLLKEFLHIASE